MMTRPSEYPAADPHAKGVSSGWDYYCGLTTSKPANPYPPGTEDSRQWEIGFNDGEHDAEVLERIEWESKAIAKIDPDVG